MSIRKECLDKATKIVTKDRNEQYGSPEDNFNKIAELWTDYLDYGLTATDVAIMMIILKIARINTGEHKDDNYIDIAGYAACGMEISRKEYEKWAEE